MVRPAFAGRSPATPFGPREAWAPTWVSLRLVSLRTRTAARRRLTRGGLSDRRRDGRGRLLALQGADLQGAAAALQHGLRCGAWGHAVACARQAGRALPGQGRVVQRGLSQAVTAVDDRRAADLPLLPGPGVFQQRPARAGPAELRPQRARHPGPLQPAVGV